MLSQCIGNFKALCSSFSSFLVQNVKNSKECISFTWSHFQYCPPLQKSSITVHFALLLFRLLSHRYRARPGKGRCLSAAMMAYLTKTSSRSDEKGWNSLSTKLQAIRLRKTSDVCTCSCKRRPSTKTMCPARFATRKTDCKPKRRELVVR